MELRKSFIEHAHERLETEVTREGIRVNNSGVSGRLERNADEVGHQDRILGRENSSQNQIKYGTPKTIAKAQVKDLDATWTHPDLPLKISRYPSEQDAYSKPSPELKLEEKGKILIRKMRRLADACSCKNKSRKGNPRKYSHVSSIGDIVGEAISRLMPWSYGKVSLSMRTRGWKLK